MTAIMVNGRQETVTPGTDIRVFLDLKGIDPAVAVVEINGSIVKREDFVTTVLNGGDSVEILRFVGGG
jgi:sulfur carrier protein